MTMISMDLLADYTEKVRAHAHETLLEIGSMPPVIGLWRNNLPYLWLQPRELTSSGDLVNLLPAAAVGMSPDFISVATDTYVTESPTKTDGTEWGRDDMARARHENTVDSHLVKDALSIVFVDRLGTVLHSSTTYEVIDTGTGSQDISWQPPLMLNYDEEPSAGGYIVDSLRFFMKEPTLDEQLQAVARGEEVDSKALNMAAAMEQLKDLAELPLEDRLRVEMVMVLTQIVIPKNVSAALCIEGDEEAAKMRQVIELFQGPGFSVREYRQGQDE